jgi:hypothetical protein
MGRYIAIIICSISVLAGARLAERRNYHRAAANYSYAYSRDPNVWYDDANDIYHIKGKLIVYDVNVSGDIDVNDVNITGDLELLGLTASRLIATDGDNLAASVLDLTDWIAGTANQVIVTDDTDGTVTLSAPQNIHTGATPTFAGMTLNGSLEIKSQNELRFADNGNYVGFEAGSLSADQIWILPTADGGTDGDIIKTDAAGTLSFVTPTVDIPIVLAMYDAEPARASETNWNGAFLSLATAQPLDSVPTDLPVTKGIGKVVIVINAGSDLDGDITVTGESIDRNTGASTPADTDTITVDALTTDSSTTDSNGNTKHVFTGAYITAKWFTGSVVLSTANLTLTDVDVYHCSFEQMNDKPNLTIDTFDFNIFTNGTSAEFDAYLFDLHVTGDKCDIHLEAELHVGADGETAIANKYWRLRRGNIAESLDGTTDGLWVDIHYSNTPSQIEDVTGKVWLTQSTALTLN